MTIRELLPIGSVVLLNNGRKRLMIIGVKQTDVETNEEYDYLGLVYPEGYINADTVFFFNHSSIDHIYYSGMVDDERDDFIERLEEFYATR